ncbi:hypothetical protein HS088_TW16G00270 [Tripterygium wilfordii]|uniref:ROTUNDIFOLIA like 8 n=1 Tax=Tripterygium wilfordii TaxID=458696 RepID=A0A7J7CIG6_TRIWF|nr:hypothetical protein HS088_TW16G00270 [Tripterygium wilfordii]
MLTLPVDSDSSLSLFNTRCFHFQPLSQYLSGFQSMESSLTQSASAPPQFYFSEKWKLSKKEGLSRSRSSTTTTTTTPLMKNSRRRCSFTRKCARLVKEQRARFYIMRRCVSMLICWNDYGDS